MPNRLKEIAKMAQYAKSAQVGFNKANEMAELLKRTISWQQKINDWYNDLIQTHHQKYPKVWDSIKDYLQVAGKIIPQDEMEFFDWFLEIRYPDLIFGQPLPTIQRVDFELFHQYQEADIKNKLAPASTPHTPTDNSPYKELNLKSLAILHVYLSKNGGQPITHQNKDEIAKKIGRISPSSGKHLFDYYQMYRDDKERLTLHTENKKAAKEHILRFENILPFLERQSTKAFQAAQVDLKLLKNIYSKHY